jgi:tetratricopeptide (TPR) repeat protein
MSQHAKPPPGTISFKNPGKERLVTIPGLGVDVPELQQARALWQRNRFDEALALFEKAVRKYPQNLVALVDASRAFGARFEIARAEVIIDKLAQLAVRNPELLHLAGQSYRMIFRPDKAIPCFEKVLSITREIPDAQLELAVLYERRHRLTDAQALIEDCLRSHPDYLEAELFKGRLLRRLKDITGAEALFRRLTASEQAHFQVKAQAWTELANMADQAGAYDEAMQSILQCKNLLIPHEGSVLKESEFMQLHLNNLIQELKPEHFNKWTADAQFFAPHRLAVLSSFPRSGTTLLEQVLDSHPDLVSSDEREAFGRDIFPSMWRSTTTPIPTVQALDSIPQKILATQRERYFTYMEAALNKPIGTHLHLDKNPSLTLLLPGLLRLFPETRLLIALRDPRDVILSCFMQYLPLNANSVSFLTLERAARRYVHDMGAWLRLREIVAARWLEVRYELCVADLEGQARRALEFLELPWDPCVLEYRARLGTKGVASPSYEAVSKPLYTSSIGRWKSYSKYLAPCLEILRPYIKAFGYEE